MLLTLYYMYATLLQWWKIGLTRSKISKAITNQSALVLYQKNRPIDKADSNIEELIFFTEDKIGCTLVPKKTISLNNWLPFSSSNFFPFSKKKYSKIGVPSFTVLIQADLKNFNNGSDYDQLQISDLGVPMAWTAAENFGIVVKTDLDNLSKLVSCFLANPIAINEGMEVLQVEMVEIQGEPKLVENDRLSKKIKWPKMINSQKQWRHLIDDLKNICKKVNQICSAQNGNICSELVVENLPQNSVESVMKPTPKILLSISKNGENHVEHKTKSESDKHKEKKTHKKDAEKEREKLERREKEKLEKSERKLERGERSEREKDRKGEEKHQKKEDKEDKEEREMRKKEKEKKIEKGETSKDDKKKDKKVEKGEHSRKKEESEHKRKERRTEEGEHSRRKEDGEHSRRKEDGEHSRRKLDERLEKVDRSKNKRTKELTQDRLKQSSSMDRIKHHKDSDKHKKDLHKSKREKFAKRHSDDRLLNKDVEIDKDISKHELRNKEKKHVEEKEIDEAMLNKKRFIKSKPPNVLVCADSSETRENVKTVLKDILNRNKYIIYELPSSGDPHFADNSTLVVVCGNVNPVLTSQLLQFFLNGGNLLCLCSDFLNSVLHTFTTAEVREHELVRFSYGNWRSVQMMHHIFCYQASPAKKHFSQDSDPNSSNQSSGNSPVAPRTPTTVELHHNNKTYTVQVQVLGTEETWHTPSILLAKVRNGDGKAVFSQVHLEIDPTQYIDDETKCIALKESDKTRLEILKDILSNHLNMDCLNSEKVSVDYKPAYFLGLNDSKQELLSELKGLTNNVLRLPKLTLQFCGKGVEPPTATDKLLPILIHSCPSNFSTVEYFENLQTETLGRLVFYCEALTSSMDVLTGAKYKNGLVVVPRNQSSGVGRGGNVWLSPPGSGMFSIQLHIPMDSELATSLPLVQHLIVVAVVSAVRSIPGYEDLPIGLKWPNDVYAYSSVKLGGVIVNSVVESTVAVCNIGFGINLNNQEPTQCLNSIILKHNEEKGTSLSPLSLEKFLAFTFTELERILNVIQNGNLDYLFDLYYKYWLHSDSVVSVHTASDVIKDVMITGIDKYGFLVVRAKDGSTSSVQPDNNTFDMMQGLIAPKIR